MRDAKLTEEAAKQADDIMLKFVEKMKKLSDETISEIYVSCISYVESDCWQNFRNDVLDGLKDYSNKKIHSIYDFKSIRDKIFEEHKDEIVNDIIVDLKAEIETLKKRIDNLIKDRY